MAKENADNFDLTIEKCDTERLRCVHGRVMESKPGSANKQHNKQPMTMTTISLTDRDTSPRQRFAPDCRIIEIVEGRNKGKSNLPMGLFETFLCGRLLVVEIFAKQRAFDAKQLLQLGRVDVGVVFDQILQKVRVWVRRW